MVGKEGLGEEKDAWGEVGWENGGGSGGGGRDVGGTLGLKQVVLIEFSLRAFITYQCRATLPGDSTQNFNKIQARVPSEPAGEL